MVQEILLRLQEAQNQVRSGRPKMVDSKAMLQAIDVNEASSTLRVSDTLSISQSSVV